MTANTNKLWTSAVLLAAVVAALGSWWLTNTHWQKKWAARDLADSQAQTATQQQARKTETASHQSVAKIDQQQYTELKNAQQTITALRADVATGTRRLQQCQSTNGYSQTAISQSAGVGNSQRADGGTGGNQIEQTILDIGEDAVTAIKQRDACVSAYQQNQQILQQ